MPCGARLHAIGGKSWKHVEKKGWNEFCGIGLQSEASVYVCVYIYLHLIKVSPHKTLTNNK